MEMICTIGIDLGKTVFHLVGVNARGEVVVRKKCSRTQLLRFTSNLRTCLIRITDNPSRNHRQEARISIFSVSLRNNATCLPAE